MNTVYLELDNSGDLLHHFKVENPKKWPSIISVFKDYNCSV